MLWLICFEVSILLGMIPELMQNILPPLLIKLYEQTVFNYLYLFLAGAFLAEYRCKILEGIKRYWYYLTIAAVVLYVLRIDVPFTRYGVVKGVLCIYGLIGFAYSYPGLNIKVDISYGIYIYHMIIVNILISLGCTGEFRWMAAAFLFTVVSAWISTKTVGVWSLKRKINHIQQRR